MLEIDAVGEIVADLIDELPQEVFDELSGGVLLVPEEKKDGANLYIMGEYQRDLIGKRVVLYYGSFAALYRHASKERWIRELRSVLRHEFMHHVEGLAGERELEVWDAIQKNRYAKGLGREPEPYERKDEK